jgi:hypothetical protein
MWLRSAAILCLWLAATTVAAGDLDDFNATLARAETHYRLALDYLRTDDAEDAAQEIGRMREAWSEIVDRFGSKPPAARADNSAYATTLTDVATRLVTATIMIDLGRRDVAREALIPIDAELSRIRPAASP